MEIVAALGGAVVGALVSVLVAHAFSSRSQRAQALAALRSELQINLEIGNRVLESNRSGGSPDWYEFIPFSDKAWRAFVGQGMLGRVGTTTAELLTRAYAMTESANFQARKIEMGTFKRRDAEAYTDRVEEAKAEVMAAFAALDNAHNQSLHGTSGLSARRP